MKYLWTEDIGAGFHFWKLVNQLFFANMLTVESKGSNQGILDYYIIACYDVLHTQGKEYLAEDITEYVKEKGDAK